ncbi:MAG: transglutaminase family protein, partial [Pirellulaceae bacterium]
VDPAGKTLTPLPLGDSDAAEQGTAVVAMGNPQGLKHSVVAGLVSARRQIDGRDMLQLAMPIEPGNSGGPVVDMRGQVLGLVNMKSTINENLGFAVEVNALKPLLASPNPIPIERWMTIGRVDTRRWLPLFGADWRQRSGRILVSGLGEGFGGRSLCLSRQSAPELPFEVAVQVKLDDESGAAGLVFHADGADRHYGFYPSGGQLRLTCFDGPSVLQWQILRETPSTFYRPGDWNWLKVRVEKDRFACFVNDHLVCESADDTFAQGQVGLAKFRDTRAEFRQFQIAKSIEASAAGSDTVQSAVRALTDPAQVAPSQIADLARSGSEAVQAIRHEARELQRRSAELIRVARDVHIAQVCEELTRLGAVPDSDMDMLRAALWIAKLDEEDIDVESYVQAVEAMAAEIAAGLPRPPAEAAAEGKQPAEPAAGVPPGAGADRVRLAALNDYLFRQNGFHGLRFDYYHRANSYLNRVIDDRAGLPITLSVLYIELGRRLGLQVDGVGVPSHFIVRVKLQDGEPQLVDVFDGGKELSRKDVERLVRERANLQLTDDHLAASSGRSILQRMLNNLRGAAAGDPEALRTYTEAMVVLSPDAVEERLKRALLRAETKRYAASLDDVDWILAQAPPGINLDAVHAFRDKVQRQINLAP